MKTTYKRHTLEMANCVEGDTRRENNLKATHAEKNNLKATHSMKTTYKRHTL